MDLHPVGHVESDLVDVAVGPMQADEGAPPAVLVFDEAVGDALRGLAVGDALVVLTWLHQAERDVLVVHPRGDDARPLTGVFATAPPPDRTRSGCTASG